MLGQPLTSYTHTFSKVGAHIGRKPFLAIEDRKDRMTPHTKELCERRDDFDFDAHYYQLSRELLSNFSLEETLRLHYSSTVTMQKSVTDYLESNLYGELILKIQSSMWRWSYSRGTWNEIVDAYNALRSFTLNLGPDFDVVLDYTTYHNERGHSKHSRTFLDGAFGYLVTYKGKHMMTIGFSILAGKTVLIQQVQLKEPQGNRWLYKLKMHRTQFALETMKRCFGGYHIYLVEGKSAYRRLYEEQVVFYRKTVQRLCKYRKQLAQANQEEDRVYYAQEIVRKVEECGSFESHLEILRRRRAAIVQCYESTVARNQNVTIERNGLLHHLVA